MTVRWKDEAGNVSDAKEIVINNIDKKRGKSYG